MAANSSNGAKKRLYLFEGSLFVWAALIAFRLIDLQVIRYGEWLQRANRQQQRSIEVPPPRGIVYDRNGEALAMTVMVESIFADPAEVPDHGTAAQLLSGIVGVDAQELKARMDGSRNFCWIARKVDAETANRVRALKLQGIGFQKEPKRFYPKRDLGAQILGYVGLDDEGLGGIEREFEEQLRGEPGKMQVSVDAKRRGLGHVERQPIPGNNVVLTIDSTIQYIAERELERAMEETKAAAATIVVQNPHTGEILALANRPTFNPNVFSKVQTEQLKNRAVTDVYEPGSVFKIVTISAALEEKLTRPDEMIDCQNGQIVVNGLRIRDHERLGLLSVAQILARSSDVGSIKLGLRLGNDRFYRYIRSFGFGQQTGIELPGETRGLAKPANRWSKVSIGAISMGQEIGVTPLQIASMVSTIANDGVWIPPRIVAGTTPPGGPKQIVFRPPEQRRVLSTMTAAEMKKMLEGVVLFGTGRKAILDGYTSAGKTGTAQKIDPATGAYSKTKYVGSFVGFAPVNSPAITIAVIIDSAQGLHQGGQVSAPVFQRVAQQVLTYLHVPYDTELKNPNRMALRASVKNTDLEESSPDHLGDSLDQIANENTAAPQIQTAGARIVAASSPSVSPAPLAAPEDPVQRVANGGTVVLDRGAGVVVPSFMGRSLRSAVEMADQAGLEIQAVGTGTARDQSPLPGTRVAPGTRIAVRFAR